MSGVEPGDVPAAETAPPQAGAAERFRRLLEADLGFHGSDGKYGTHGWHPFPAKFPPQLPRHFIESLSDPGDVVFDPMSGSGTTLVEAQRLGRRALGCDIDPLARMMATAKLTPLDPVAALQAGRDVLRQAARVEREGREELATALDRRFDDATRKFVDYWFLPDQQIELLALVRQIEELEKGPLRTFLKVVFSGTIIAKSGGVSLARDLAHTRPHRVMTKRLRSAFVEFDKKLESNVGGLSAARTIPADVLAAPAQATGLEEGSVALIVTSPPYANNAIDYMRAHKFSLVWLGWRIEDLTLLRKRYIGHDAVGERQQLRLPEVSEETLRALEAVDPRKAAVLRRYFAEIHGVLAEMKRVLRLGGSAAVVVASSVLRGLDVQTHRNLAAIGESLGLELAGIGVRQLDRDKRMMPARWGSSGASGIEKRMHDEYVIGFVKR